MTLLGLLGLAPATRNWVRAGRRRGHVRTRRHLTRALVATTLIGSVLSGCGGVGDLTPGSGNPPTSKGADLPLAKSGLVSVHTNFSYDPVGQLLEVNSEQRKLTNFNYDPVGNILSKLGGPHSGQFAYNSVNSQTSPAIDNDAQGQVTKSQGNRLEWDSAGRVVAIDRGSNERTEFAYDGLGRRSRITERKGNKVLSDKTYFWLGGAIVSERDVRQAGAPVTKRYFSQGVLHNGNSLYYTFDHLGSIRELVDSTGKVRAAYHYASYGRRSKVLGDLDSDWGFAGLWHHEPSGLDLATYRAYDATRGWLSRDPLGEAAGINMLAYCGGDPINFSDPLGLQSQEKLWQLLDQRVNAGLVYWGGFLDKEVGPCCLDSALGYYQKPRGAALPPGSLAGPEDFPEFAAREGLKSHDAARIGDFAYFDGHVGVVVAKTSEGEPVIYGADGNTGRWSGTLAQWNNVFPFSQGFFGNDESPRNLQIEHYQEDLELWGPKGTPIPRRHSSIDCGPDGESGPRPDPYAIYGAR